MAGRKSTRSRAKEPGRGNEIRTHPFDLSKFVKNKEGKRKSPKDAAAWDRARSEMLGLVCSLVWCSRELMPNKSGRYLRQVLLAMGRQLCEITLFLGQVGAARKIPGNSQGKVIRTQRGVNAVWRGLIRIVDKEYPRPGKRKLRAKPSGGAS